LYRCKFAGNSNAFFSEYGWVHLMLTKWVKSKLALTTTVACIRVPSHDSQLEASPYQVYGLSPLPPALRFESQSLRRGVAIRPSLTGKEFRLPSPSQLSKLYFFATFPHIFLWFQVNVLHGSFATLA